MFDVTEFEGEFRHALRTTAASGRALEINTVVPLDATIVRWWYDEGGEAVTFGSDAHEPASVARGFTDAAALAAASGFRPTDDLFEPVAAHLGARVPIPWPAARRSWHATLASLPLDSNDASIAFASSASPIARTERRSLARPRIGTYST